MSKDIQYRVELCEKIFTIETDQKYLAVYKAAKYAKAEENDIAIISWDNKSEKISVVEATTYLKRFGHI